MSIKTAKQMVAIRQEQLESAKEDLKLAVSEAFLKCNHCKKRSKIKSITLVQTYWYEQPRGCIDGDIWHRGEKIFICPKCDKRNRTFNNDKFKALSNYSESFAKFVSEKDLD